MTHTAQQPSGRGPLQSRTGRLARGVLVAALVFSTYYTARITLNVITGKTSTSGIAKPFVVGGLALATLVAVELLVLGLNASFLRDRIVPRERMRVAYVVLAATAAAAFGLALAGDAAFALSVLTLLLPGAAAYGILTLFSPEYLARQEHIARERERQRAAARAARSGTRAARPASKPASGRTQTSTKAKQRRGGRKRR